MSTEEPSPSNSQEQPTLRADQQGFDTRTVTVLSAGHFAHDSYPAFVGVLLPLLIQKLGLSLAAAGLLASGIRWTTLVQPVLGHWADRTDTRYWVVVAPTTTAFLISLLGVVPSYTALLVLLLLAGFSHAAFHPAAGAMITRASGTRWGKGMSFFMTGGELGRAVGPLYIAAVVAAVGLEWSWIAFVPGLLVSVVLYWRIARQNRLPLPHRPGNIRQAVRSGRRPLSLLSAAIVLRSVMNVGLVVFYPTFATQSGTSLLAAGLAVTVYEIGGAAGALLGGTISDRLGRKAVLLSGLLLGVPASVGAVLVGLTPVGLALLAVAGLTVLTGYPVHLVLMQELLPDNRSAAVGITYFMTTGGAIVATLAVGVLGNLMGLRQAILAAAASGLLALVFVLLLPETRRVR